jgi:hypothetical protein
MCPRLPFCLRSASALPPLCLRSASVRATTAPPPRLMAQRNWQELFAAQMNFAAWCFPASAANALVTFAHR